MDAFFTKLGQAVLEQWKRANFSLDQFPSIAAAALEARPPAKHVDLAALMEAFLLDEDHPAQTDSAFGEPEIVVYSHPRFYIQLLFWMDGTTAIHQHEFSGAFHVLRGSSISADYQFESARSITPYLRIGDVQLKKIAILETGRTVPIVSGRASIHSLFHLDSPSITVVIRTQHDPGTGPQFNYLPPHVAIDPHHVDLLILRRTQLLDVMEQTEDPGYAETVMRMIADLDFERGFMILRHCMGHLQQLDEWNEAIKTFEHRHGSLAAGIAPTLLEEARREIIKGLRSTITDPDHRFFLALLMNAPTPADLFTLTKQRYPKQKPIDLVMRWASELVDVSDEGVAILDAIFPETIAIDADAKPALFLSALHHFMQGKKERPPALSKLSKQDLKELRDSLAASVLRSLLV